ncbi:respiratory nitrate reductase subunit gamma [Nocardia rhamnosiphila]
MFQARGLFVLALLAVWPDTRLVHMSSAPVGYLARPYVVSQQGGRGAGHTPLRPCLGPPVAPDRWSRTRSQGRVSTPGTPSCQLLRRSPAPAQSTNRSRRCRTS